MKKWLKTLFISCALVLTGACFVSAYTSTSRGVMPLYAEGEETSEPVVEEEPAEEPVEEAEEKENWVKQAYDTYIVPLFAGVSATSVVSAVVCIVATVLKNKELNKKLLAMNENFNAQKQEADKKLALAEEKLAEATEMLALAREGYALIKENDAINKETKKFLVDNMNFILKKIEENSNEVAKIEKVQKVLSLLVQLDAKVAKQSQEVVKSGIIEDVNELIALVKAI